MRLDQLEWEFVGGPIVCCLMPPISIWKVEKPDGEVFYTIESPDKEWFCCDPLTAQAILYHLLEEREKAACW